jgi:hypothetical protein
VIGFVHGEANPQAATVLAKAITGRVEYLGRVEQQGAMLQFLDSGMHTPGSDLLIVIGTIQI